MYTSSQFKEACYLFNSIAGKAHLTSKKDIKFQLDLIKSELQECYDALEANDLVGILDGYADVLVTTYGLGQKLDYLNCNTEDACKAVAANNLSKFISEPSVLERNQVKYTFPEYKIEYNNRFGRWIIKNSNDKVMKPVDFVSVDLTPFVPANAKMED